jgi:hypothetical protein
MVKKAIISLSVMAMLLLTSCVSTYELSAPKDTNPPMYSNWLSPTKVIISNFHAGATAEYQITFHNAKQTTTDQKEVTTVDNDYQVDFPLDSAGLLLNDISSITEVNSDNPLDKLILVSYDSMNNTVLIGGLISNSVRIITLTYKPMTSYVVCARMPDTSYTESAKMVLGSGLISVSNPTLVLAPLETDNDTIIISLPNDVTLNDKEWEFWVGVYEVSRSSGVSISGELVSRWIVQMKDSSAG